MKLYQERPFTSSYAQDMNALLYQLTRQRYVQGLLSWAILYVILISYSFYYLLLGISYSLIIQYLTVLVYSSYLSSPCSSFSIKLYFVFFLILKIEHLQCKHTIGCSCWRRCAILPSCTQLIKIVYFYIAGTS